MSGVVHSASSATTAISESAASVSVTSGGRSRAGGQLRAALGDRIRREAARPLREAGPRVEQGERGLRLGHGIDVGGRQPSLVREVYGGALVAGGQRECLGAAEVRAGGEFAAISSSATVISRSTSSAGRAGLAASPHRMWFTRAHPARRAGSARGFLSGSPGSPYHQTLLSPVVCSAWTAQFELDSLD